MQAFLETAEEAARAAGRVLLGYFRRLTSFDYKGARDLVTEGDRHSERVICKVLVERFPGHVFYTEEDRERPDASGIKDNWVWFVDPLDGTTNFVHGIGFFSVTLCLYGHGRPLLGLVYDPVAEEMFTAVRGEGARLNGQPVRVSTSWALPESLLATGFAYNLTDSDNTDHVAHFVPLIRDLRRMGSAALDLAYVACGRLDGYWEYGLEAWDHAGGALLVEEAGGQVTDFTGRPMRYDYKSIAASNGLIHLDMLKVLAQGRTGMGQA